MRRIVMVMAIVAAAQSAQGADLSDLADLPILRGSLREGMSRPAYWQGYYVGGQAGLGSSDMDFTGSAGDLIARMMAGTAIENQGSVSDWPVMGKVSQRGKGYGGFVGYNLQWDDVVLGLEANYLHGNFGGSSSDSMSRIFSTTNGFTNNVTYAASSTLNIRDMGSVRARAGYVWNNFMPYMFGGVSLGQADVVKTARISGTQVNDADPTIIVPFDDTMTTRQNGRFIYGYAAGLGVDIMLFGNVFVRGEWEYLKFVGPVDTSINTVRGGVGYKF